LSDFLKQKNENSEIHIIPVNELDSLMANFIIASKKKDGSDYEPTSLRGIVMPPENSHPTSLIHIKYPAQNP
jgi:hypothetical protein